MNKANVYNGIYPHQGMAKAEKGTTIFLTDADIIELFRSKKLNITIDGDEIIITYLQGNAIEEKTITAFGRKGYFHIAVGQIGLAHETAFVVPAMKRRTETEAETEKEVRT